MCPAVATRWRRPPLQGWVSAQFEGSRSAGEIQKFWQNWEHPSINKQEWSGQEVGQLKAIAAQHGHLEWQKIAEELGVRSGPAETLRAVSVRGPRFEAFMGCVTHSQGCPVGPLRVCLSG